MVYVGDGGWGIAMLEDDHNQLVSELISCIENLKNWQNVLALLCTMTGAEKALVSLRNHNDSHLFLHPDLPTSPFQYNFDPNQAEIYLNRYAIRDVWCEIQTQHPPITPLVMSDHLPLSELHQTEFWKWLEPQGVDDTVVVRIGEAHGGWVALNLYFASQQSPDLERAVAVLTRHLQILKDTLALGFKAHQSSADVEQLCDMLHAPYLVQAICREDGSIVHGKLPQEAVGLEQDSIVKWLRQSSSVQAISFGETKLGEQRAYYIVRDSTQPFRKSLIIPRADLREPQPTIIEVLREGGTLKDCAIKTGMHLNGVRYHWDKMKVRYGFNDTSDVHGAHITLT